ncbi:GNAT family N-acetyltransferase [Bacteroides oleiciplenus]|uniref:GNAT family N-acetyltransferase n=1 Tax=Bacteroides oleiciplenus TaxID=626931 RepID=A0A3E5BS23_9BACE|nr:GNAT family N-acetyltransferase [Bacteroides oleiciplenus]RGN40427.1 GNAT family N-acetyltransferase [Bacteroides oleiciplenus]
MIVIRRLEQLEYENAVTLSLEVYLQCGEEDFDEQGLESFKSFVNDKEVVNRLVIYGAFDGDNLVGVLATKNEGEHISLFFIKKEYHRKGIGRKLFDALIGDDPVSGMTVNSSSYAVPFYRSLGFREVKEPQVTNGLRYVPMKRE